MHEGPVSLNCCYALGSFADQDMVRSRSNAGADAEQGIKDSIAVSGAD